MGCDSNLICSVSDRLYCNSSSYPWIDKKLTRLDKVSSDLRIVSDKLSDTLATTTIDTAQKVGERKVQAALAKAELLETTAAQKEKNC